MTDNPEMDPYRLYSQDNLLNSNPVELVVALYQGAIDSIRSAKESLKTRDIPGRTKAINKAYNILSELLVSLDHEKGKEISKNLGELYTYMQQQILEAHRKQNASPLEEVEKLLSNLLEGWKQASSKYDPFAIAAELTITHEAIEDSIAKPEPSPYGSYTFDYADLAARQAYSF